MFDEQQRALLDLPAFATLVTLMSDGHPQGSVMWYRRDGDTIRMIAPASAVKTKNLERDPRSTIIVGHPDSGYTYLELRCHAEVVHDDVAALDELLQIASRYIGDQARDYVDALSDAPRVLLVFHPKRVRSRFRDG